MRYYFNRALYKKLKYQANKNTFLSLYGMMDRFLKISLLVPFMILGNLNAQPAKDNYSSSSVLSSGKWFKIAVLNDGIYRIDFSKLKQLGLSNPANPRIFANNFGQLSFYNNDPKPDDLKEVSILTVTGSDGIFNEGDYLLFYGQGTGRWKYNETTGLYDFIAHNYSDTAFYFLTSGSAGGRKVTAIEAPEADPSFFSSESDALFVHEEDKENLFKSGREWYQPVSPITGITVNPGFSNLVTGEKINFRIKVLARAPVTTLFRLYEGTVIQKSIQVQAVNLQNYTGTYAQITDSSGSALPSSASPVYQLKFFNNGETGAKGWLDFITVQGRKRNIYSGTVSFYSDSRSAGPGRITSLIFTSSAGSPSVWDITDPFDPGSVQYTMNGNQITFKASTDNIRKYIFFNEASAASPIIKANPVASQDLHGTDPVNMIIVTHPLFRKYAEDLAGFHLKNSGLLSLVVTTEEIYNEFSGGIPDIAAIRNFVRMKFMRQSGTQIPLKYLLLFGDGSYENKTLPPNNPNYVPTYQSQNSNVVVSSFTSDDFYGLLEDGEGEADGTEDIGIGRLPVSDTNQAGIVLRKIFRYLNPSNTGDWKNVICLTADDEDGNAHMSDAEGLSSVIEEKAPSFNVNKIYLDAFRQTTSVTGQSYPDVSTAINNRINSGCLIFNYTGHGSEIGLAHERVVKTEDIKSWNNGSKLPLFITATCEFSRFDDADQNLVTRELTPKTSAGEMVLFNENGGAIALMSTTRVVYSAPNYFLNKNIFNVAFNHDSSGKALCLGDIIRLAKINSGNGPNKRNFSLLGDPAVRLSFPWHGTVVTDSINSVAVISNPDSLKALKKVTISGHVEDNNGHVADNFNGVVAPLVFDKVSVIRTLANDGGQSMVFNLRNNILFSGKTTASKGKFRFTFIVPRDIDYAYGPGKISYYANDSSTDMNGYFSEIIVGGFASSTVIDTSGPDIRLYMNDTLFRNGGITDNNPRMLAIIEDKGGINTTGAGIGHDITGYLDNNQNKTFVLNTFFENDFDNYMKGKIYYDFTGLAKGNHSLTIKAWDNFNNSSEKSLVFFVETGGKFILTNLFNYPNPVSIETKISVEHNRPDENLNITISIFDMSGRVIRMLNSSAYSTGYRISPITWDGTSEGGKRAGRGVYPYRITVRTGSGETAISSGSIIIL